MLPRAPPSGFMNARQCVDSKKAPLTTKLATGFAIVFCFRCFFDSPGAFWIQRSSPRTGMMLPRAPPSGLMNARQCADSKETRLKIKLATGFAIFFCFRGFFDSPSYFWAQRSSSRIGVMLPRIPPSGLMNARQCADLKKTRLKIKLATGFAIVLCFRGFFDFPSYFWVQRSSPRNAMMLPRIPPSGPMNARQCADSKKPCLKIKLATGFAIVFCFRVFFDCSTYFWVQRSSSRNAMMLPRAPPSGPMNARQCADSNKTRLRIKLTTGCAIVFCFRVFFDSSNYFWVHRSPPRNAMMLPRVRPSDPMNARQCADSKKTRLKIKRATGFVIVFCFRVFFDCPSYFRV